jgi:para-nitrobenzyl esterase
VSDTHPSTTTVTISSGTLRGSVRSGIRRFLGIPYAHPPFGDDRFAAPRAVGAWEGVRDATAFGPTPPQDPYFGAIGELLGSVEIPGDDILTVNVWAPEDAQDLPVMVWLYGGALERGSTALPDYDGESFAAEGIVYVSIGYRVGAEGFSVLDGAPRNLGLEDAAAGLQWVVGEIAAFGGDPAKITLAGESAGGALVAALLSRPDTVAVARGAIIQSGPLDGVPEASARRVSDEIAARLEIAPTREAFTAVSPGTLLEARRALAAGGNILLGSPSYQLAVDENSLPVSPRAGIVDVPVPVLIGTNTDEYRLWFPPEAVAAVSDLQVAGITAALKLPASTVDVYRETLPDASPGEVLGQILTDVLLRHPAIEAAGRRDAATYVYEFAWRSPVRDLRAAHAMEIAFAFDHLDGAAAEHLAGPDAPQALADRMHADWVRFVKIGDPGWEPFGDARGIRRYDETSEDVPLPRAAVLDALDGALAD